MKEQNEAVTMNDEAVDIKSKDVQVEQMEPQKFDINKASKQELKGVAYDLSRNLNVIQRQLQMVDVRIAEVEKLEKNGV